MEKQEAEIVSKYDIDVIRTVKSCFSAREVGMDQWCSDEAESCPHLSLCQILQKRLAVTNGGVKHEPVGK
jgi:hypothetical protein